MNKLYNILFLSLLLPAFILNINAQEQKLNTADIFAKVSNSVVKVYAYDFNGIPNSQGSGVVIGKGKIITNYHVFDGNEKLEIQHFGKSYSDIRILFADPNIDLLILQVNDCNLTPIQISKTDDDVYIGAKVYAIGSPREFENTITDGIISGIRNYTDTSNYSIQITAGITHGSSGGAVVNEFGDLIGISTYVYEYTNINLNFAVPIYLVKDDSSWCQSNDETCLESLEKSCKAYNLVTVAVKKIELFYNFAIDNEISDAIKMVRESFESNFFQSRSREVIYKILKKFKLKENHFEEIKNLKKYFGVGFEDLLNGLKQAELKENYFQAYHDIIDAVNIEKDNSHYYYFLAMAYALNGKINSAFKFMLKASILGDKDANEWLQGKNIQYRFY